MVARGLRRIATASRSERRASESESRQCLQHPSRNQANEEGRKERRDIFLVLFGAVAMSLVPWKSRTEHKPR